jgi:hypothetical protein
MLYAALSCSRRRISNNHLKALVSPSSPPKSHRRDNDNDWHKIHEEANIPPHDIHKVIASWNTFLGFHDALWLWRRAIKGRRRTERRRSEWRLLSWEPFSPQLVVLTMLFMATDCRQSPSPNNVSFARYSRDLYVMASAVKLDDFPAGSRWRATKRREILFPDEPGRFIIVNPGNNET